MTLHPDDDDRDFDQFLRTALAEIVQHDLAHAPPSRIAWSKQRTASSRRRYAYRRWGGPVLVAAAFLVLTIGILLFIPRGAGPHTPDATGPRTAAPLPSAPLPSSSASTSVPTSSATTSQHTVTLPVAPVQTGTVQAGHADNQPPPVAPQPVEVSPSSAGLNHKPQIFRVMNTSEKAPDGVYFRNSAHTADTDQVVGHGVYAGDEVQDICYAIGDPVGPFNDRIWYQVRNVTRPTVPGSGASNSGWLNAHYIDDGLSATEVDPEVPAC
jgi:hypothetical protein